MKLAIASPSGSAYSETFIHMQMDELPCRLRIHGGPIASETLPGGAIRPSISLSSFWDALIEYGLRRRGKGGFQSAQLRRRLKKAGISVILANYGPVGVALMPLCRELGIKLVVHFHGYDAHQAHILDRFSKSYQDLGDFASKIIAVSGPMKASLVNLGIHEEKIAILRYGAKTSIFVMKRQIPEKPVFFGVGRFVDKKAPYLTLLAFALVVKEHPQARLILGGDGPLLEATRNLADHLKLHDSVILPGILSREEVAKHMSECTAYVQHSIIPAMGPTKGDSEGTPVAILEALVSGVPVISTRHAGISEVVKDQETGLLVDERDVDAMAQAMHRLAKYPELVRDMGESAKADATTKYTSEVYLNSLRSILSSI
jgi:glycosyltransferase involved in cell wall biosynthesis